MVAVSLRTAKLGQSRKPETNNEIIRQSLIPK